MTDAELDKVNSERAKRGLPPLSREQAQKVIAASGITDAGFDFVGFLIGLATGVPIGPRGLTFEAIMGMTLHDLNHAAPILADAASPLADETPTLEPVADQTPDPTPSSDSGSNSGGGTE